VEVAAGQSADLTIEVSLTALAEWDPAARQRIEPDPSDVTLEVGSHAHDQAAILIELSTP